MSDRLAQARAEAERRVATRRERLWDTEGEHLSHSWGAGFQAGFREAAEWADANPQPTTITRAELEQAWWDTCPDAVDHVLDKFVRRLGIEVTEDGGV